MDTVELHDTCPMCNALLSLEIPNAPAAAFVCPYCKNALEVGSSDPTDHHLYEIDPDIPDRMFGVFQFHLIPPGATVCVQCEQIYPKAFECCPKLVDLALAEYGHPTSKWGPNTQERIAEFLTTNRVVVENTVKLRLLEAKHGKLDPEVAEQIRHCVRCLALPWMTVETDE